MVQRAPTVDKRTRSHLESQLEVSLAKTSGGGQTQGAAKAIVKVFSRFAEIVVEQINQVPDRNRVAFLSYLGGTLLPPQPARVPLMFSLVPGSAVAAVVPTGTQVAAAPAPGASAPVIFETESELVVTAAKLDQIFVRTPEQDRYSNFSAALIQRSANPVPVFVGLMPLEHSIYIGHSSFFGKQALNELVVGFDIEEGAPQPQRSITWELLSDSKAVALTPENDGTAGLVQSGDIVFRNLDPFAVSSVNGQTGYWLRGRLESPLLNPTIVRSITLERRIEKVGLLPESAFLNTSKVDLGKDFYPLGDHPKFGDAFYLTNSTAFSQPGAGVTLRISATNPAIGEGDVPVPRVNAAGHAIVTWEYWDGARWKELGAMSTDQEINNAVTLFSDSTRAFTASGKVHFNVPPDMQSSDVGGVHAKWVRARLSVSNYGDEAGYSVFETKPGVLEYRYKPSTISAPILKSVQVDVSLEETAQRPEFILTYNDFTFRSVADKLAEAMGNAPVFTPSDDEEPSLYLGFDPLPGLGMPTLPVTLYFVFEPAPHLPYDTSRLALQRTVWQFWDGTDWKAFGVIDKTGAFSYSGPITFLAPPGARPSYEFGIHRHWLRVPWRGGSKDMTAPLALVALNTTLATQTITLTNEILGSSSGAPSLKFHSARFPVLEGEVLDVFDPTGSSEAKTPGGWTSWKSVSDFHASRPFDLHYVIDRLTGEITFGDGISGAVPTEGSSNIRLTRYRTGGGSAGNKASNTIVQLKTTIPYVRGVTNPEPASGGADAETLQQLLERAPKSFRHRSRAVTIEDFEDIALLASPVVARARCVALFNLLLDPAAKQVRPGVVSVIVVPRLSGHKPKPSQELLSRVRRYLEDRQSATVDLVVLGPEYVEINVSLEVGVTTLEGVTELEFCIQKTLLEFMDPLSGGFDHAGWDFGRQPHRSDLLSLVSSINGVDHIRTLRFTEREERPGASKTDRFLACPGELQIAFTLV